MPLTERGRALLEQLPGAGFRSPGGAGCRIVRHEELCVGCGRCAAACPSGASSRGETFDPRQLLDAPAESRRGAMGAALRTIARHTPVDVVVVPPRVTVFRTIVYDDEKCLGCGACARGCPTGAIEALAPEVVRARTVGAEDVRAESVRAQADVAHGGAR